MFQDLVVLSPVNDVQVRFRDVDDWSFAASLPSIAITSDEAAQLAEEYVLAFSGDAASTPICLLGIDAKNNYVKPDGGWVAQAVPARIRLYPFAAAANPASGTVVALRDAAAPHFAGAGGAPLFEADGTPSDLVAQLDGKLTETHLGLARARALAGELSDAGLLHSVPLVLKVEGGASHILTGFKMVNADKLAQIDEPTRIRLAGSGALALAAAQQRSLASAARLMAAAQASQPAAAPKKRARTRKVADAAPAQAEAAPVEKKKRAPRKSAA